MPAIPSGQFTPRDVARVICRHFRLMAAIFFSVVLLTLLVIALYPRGYTSEAKLFLRVGRESVALDPTATTGQTIMLQKTQVDEVNSALQVLTSQEVLQRVVERVGAQQIVSDTPQAPAGASGPPAKKQLLWVQKLSEAKSWFMSQATGVLAKLQLMDPGTLEDVAIRKLASKVQAYAPKDSTVFTVSYTSGSPQLAHDVVDAVTNEFLAAHLRVNRTDGSQKFFAQQVESLKKDLAAAETALRDRKNEFQISTIDTRRNVLAEQQKDIELQLQSTQRELAYTDAQIADLAQAIQQLKPEIVTNRVAGFANEASDLMREKLYELEIQESKLKSQYQAGHPLLAQVEQQRKQAEEIVKKMPTERTQTTAELNSTQRTLELDLLQAKAHREALLARQVASQKQEADLNIQLKELNDHDAQLQQLERTVQLLDGKYRMHFEKLEEARVNEELGRDGIQNIKVAQAATLVTKPTSPKKPIVLALGLLAAVAGAVTVPFIAEILDGTLRTTRQVETELGLPVLMSFAQQHKRRRKPQKSQAAGGKKTVRGIDWEDDDLEGNYRSLACELLYNSIRASGDLQSKAVGIVGCDTTNIRSQVAEELALQAAHWGSEPVLLIDADEQRRQVANRFGLNGSPGWREVLAGVADAETCVHAANGGRLAVMTPGAEDSLLADVGHVPLGRGQLDELKNRYGLVVVDLPSPCQIDARAAGDWLDEAVLVVEAERTRTESAKRAKALLERAGIRVTGVVLANRREYVPRWLYNRI